MHHTCAVPALPGGAFTCGRALRLGACAPHAHAPAFLGARYPCRETRGRASPQTNRYYDVSISAVGPADTELGGRGRALHRLWRRREGQAPAGGHLAVARAHSDAAPSRCRYEFHTQVLRPNNAGCWQTQGWPLTDFATASAIAIAYLVFVVFGSAIMSKLPSMQVDTAHPALPSCGAMLTPRLLVTLRAQNYTFPLRFLYNLMQVGLCSYMTIEAGILAYRNNYRSHFLCVKMPCVCVCV